jgi:hypothetical protein
MFFKSWLDSNRLRSIGVLFASAVALLSLAVLSACTVTTASDGTVEGTGNLTVNWTIASSPNATQCSVYNAQTVSIQVFNSNGLQAGSATASCTSLTATISALPVGNYTIQAEVLDVSGGALASLAAPVAATINDLATTSETVDFSAASFTTPVAGTGTLTINWTIANSADASLCASHSAQTMSIQIFNASNIQYGSATTVDCSALTASIVGLPAGTYTIQVQMLDVNGASISSLVGPLTETLTSGEVTTQAIDFPDEAFGAVTTNANTGALTVSWTVAESARASGCSANDAASIVLQLLDANNNPVGATQSVDCTAFTASLTDLTPGAYTLTAKLVDASGADVTTTVTIPQIVITAATGTAQPIDFPTTSFLMSASGTGSISVTWTISSGTTVSSCGAHNAASISLQLYQSDGVTPLGAPIIDPCPAFATTISNLAPGAYALSAQLVNSTQTVSTLIPPQPITVTAGGNATQAFDFPTSSF